MRKSLWVVLLLVAVLAVASLWGCAKKTVAPEPTPSPEPTATPIPPTSTPAPTATPTPFVDLRQQKIDAFKSKVRTIHFDYDKASIRSDDGDALRGNYGLFREYAEFKILIEGHCDERGSNEYNYHLGMRRANSTLKYLVACGSDKDQFQVISYGEEKPAAYGHDESSWSQNRRAEFSLILE